MKETMTIAQAAKLLNVSEETIRRWVNSGNLPGIDILPGAGAAASVPTATATPATAKETAATYTANLALRRSHIASRVAVESNTQQPATSQAIPENAVTPPTFTDRFLLQADSANTSGLSAEMKPSHQATEDERASQTDQSNPISDQERFAADADDWPQDIADEFINCINLLQDAATALRTMINASLLAHEYAQSLDDLCNDMTSFNAQ